MSEQLYIDESTIQKGIINWCDKQNRSDLMVFAVPNGGGRNKAEASELKRQGVLAGVSDLIIILKNKIIFMEIKTIKGVLSEMQKKFEQDVTNLGYEYKVCRSTFEAVNIIKEELK